MRNVKTKTSTITNRKHKNKIYVTNKEKKYGNADL